MASAQSGATHIHKQMTAPLRIPILMAAVQGYLSRTTSPVTATTTSTIQAANRTVSTTPTAPTLPAHDALSHDAFITRPLSFQTLLDITCTPAPC